MTARRIREYKEVLLCLVGNYLQQIFAPAAGLDYQPPALAPYASDQSYVDLNGVIVRNYIRIIGINAFSKGNNK